MLRKLAFLSGFLLCGTAYGHTIHVAGNTFQLDVEKHTAPALGVRIGDKILYGAFYPGAALGTTMHVRTDAEYWLGQNCPAGAYSETGMSECQDCGYGYYCGGGMGRTVCTYGAISCNGKTHGSDAPRVDGAPINTLLTLDEVNEYIPEINLSDWRLVFKCALLKGASYLDTNTLIGTTNACAHGTIGPGTYLFVARYGPSDLVAAANDSVDGTARHITNAFIAVFDHPVGYAAMHGNGIFQHFIDTEHPVYQTYTISTASSGNAGWILNKNATNVPNLADLPLGTMLYLYELK